MTNLEKIIFSKEWSMFFNIPKNKIINNLFIMSDLFLKYFDKKKLKKGEEQEKWAWEMFFSTFTMLSPLRSI